MKYWQENPRDWIYNEDYHEVDVCSRFDKTLEQMAPPDAEDFEQYMPIPDHSEGNHSALTEQLYRRISAYYETDDELTVLNPSYWKPWDESVTYVTLQQYLRYYCGLKPIPSFTAAEHEPGDLKHILSFDPKALLKDITTGTMRTVSFFAEEVIKLPSEQHPSLRDIFDLHPLYPAPRTATSINARFIKSLITKDLTGKGNNPPQITTNWFLLDIAAKYDDFPFKIVVESGTTALACVRMFRSDDGGPRTSTELVRFLAIHGSRFHTMKKYDQDTHYEAKSNAGLGFREKGFIAYQDDYESYERHIRELLSLPHARAAGMASAIIWRLSIHILGYETIRRVLTGPVFPVKGLMFKLEIDGLMYWDNMLSEGDLEVISGVYRVWDCESPSFTQSELKLNVNSWKCRSNLLVASF